MSDTEGTGTYAGPFRMPRGRATRLASLTDQEIHDMATAITKNTTPEVKAAPAKAASKAEVVIPTIDPKALLAQRHNEVDAAKEALEDLQGEIRSGDEGITAGDLAAAAAAVEFAQLKVEAAESAVRRAKAQAEKSHELAEALVDDLRAIVKMPVAIVDKMPTGEPESGEVPQAYLIPGSMKLREGGIGLPHLEGTLKLVVIRDEMSSTLSHSKIAQRLGAAGQALTVSQGATSTLAEELEQDEFSIRVGRGYAPIPRGTGHAPLFLSSWSKNLATAVSNRAWSHHHELTFTNTLPGGVKVESDTTDGDGLHTLTLSSSVTAWNINKGTSTIEQLHADLGYVLRDMVGTIGTYGRVQSAEVTKKSVAKVGDYGLMGAYSAYRVTYVSRVTKP